MVKRRKEPSAVNYKRPTTALMVLLTLLLGVSGTMAGDPQPSGEVSITAVVASKFSYQGVLKEDGSPVTGSRDMTFRLYADDACTSQAGSELATPGVPVANGLFSVELVVDQSLFNGQGLWLEVAVGGTAIACQEILPVPYALSLRPGATISGAEATSLLVRNTSTSNGSNAVQASASGANGQTYGVVGLNNSTSGRGVLGHAQASSGLVYGVVGRAESSGDYTAGVYGYAPAASGQTFGVLGRTDSSDDWATGVQGHASAASGQTYGIRGYSASTSGRGVAGHASAASGVTYGVFGQTDSSYDSATGVRGYATATSGQTYGVFGQTDSSGYAVGVVGKATATSGLTRGVYGLTFSSGLGAAGVTGYATAASGLTSGVNGATDSSHDDAAGVRGSANAFTGSADGVKGESHSPDGYGVYGVNQYGGYAGYFDGDLHVDGTLSESGGSFKIDHPLDPENQYLSHSFVESPDMMDVYNGNAVLDANGRAWVELPDYFEALNRDFRYQLTCIGGFAPVYVAHEIQDNRFQIAGGEPGLKVSWQVTGIRQDPWANANRIPVEEDKAADEQGYYLHPEAYGLPASQGIDRPPDLEE